MPAVFTTYSLAYLDAQTMASGLQPAIGDTSHYGQANLSSQRAFLSRLRRVSIAGSGVREKAQREPSGLGGVDRLGNVRRTDRHYSPILAALARQASTWRR